MIDEVLHLTKHLDDLKIDEDLVLRLAQDFKRLNIDQRRAREADLLRKYRSDLHPQLRQILDMAVHISQCRTPRCPYPGCRNVKGFVRHSVLCKIRVAGGCQKCNKMWLILKVHTLACNVPRCRNLKLSDPQQGAANRGGSRICNYTISWCIGMKECRERQSDSKREAAKLAASLGSKGTPENLRSILDLVMHIFYCLADSCRYPNCDYAKGLFYHYKLCKTRLTGGCRECYRTWRLLLLHARACEESNCKIIRCRDLKKHPLLHLDPNLGGPPHVACIS